MGFRLAGLAACGVSLAWGGDAIALPPPLPSSSEAPLQSLDQPTADALGAPALACQPELLEDDHTACLSQLPVEKIPLAADEPIPQALESPSEPAAIPNPSASVADLAQAPESAPLTESAPPAESTPLDLPPEVIQNSPVLQEWLQRTPDIASEIANDPSFRTRLRLGYSRFPSSGGIGGFNAGVEDVFVWPGTGLTLSGDYARSWDGQREDYGAEARYYVFPLGGIVNFAPVLGYRQLTTSRYSTSGLDVGMRLMIIPSRGGGADVAISQTWVAPGTQDEIGMTGASIGYAVTSHLRLSTELQFQNSRFGQDSHLGLSLEWLL